MQPSGNVYLAYTSAAPTNSGGVILLPFGVPQEVNFLSTAAQTVTLFNSGNTTLTLTGLSTDTTNFVLTGSTCTATTTLAPSGSCTIGVEPIAGLYGVNTGNVIVTDNVLNQPGSTQSIPLSYTGPAPPAAITFNPASPVADHYSTLLTASCNSDSDPISFSIVSGPAALSGPNNSLISYNGNGAVVIQATDVAPPLGTAECPTVTRTVMVVTQQTINFPQPTQTTYPGSATLAATATSGLPVTYTVLSGPATVFGSTLTYTDDGTVIVQATQAGNSTNVAASPVSVTVHVTLAEVLINWSPSVLKIYTGTPLGTGVIDATDSIPATISYTAALTPSGSAVPVTTATVLSQGSYTLTALFTPNDTTNYAVVSDAFPFDVQNMNIFVGNDVPGVASFFNNGTLQSSAIGGGGIGAAVDKAGYVWSANADGSGVTRYTTVGVPAGSYTAAAGISSPTAVAVDGAGAVWVANSGNGTVSEYTNAGSALSPPAGFSAASTGASGIAIDISGNVWTANHGGNSVTKLLGAAAPTVPLTTGVANATPATEP